MKRRSAITKAVPTTEGATPKKKPKPMGKQDSRLGGVSKKNRVNQVSPENRATELLQQTQAMQLRMRGFTQGMIAEALDVAHGTVPRLIARAMDEYLTDRDEVVHFYFGMQRARYDKAMRTWDPRAMGYTKPDGTVVEPDPEAMRLWLRLQRDLNQLIGYGQTVRVEHTGAAGGPIMTASLDLVAAAEIARQTFSGGVAPMMILAEGQSPPEDDGRRH